MKTASLHITLTSSLSPPNDFGKAIFFIILCKGNWPICFLCPVVSTYADPGVFTSMAGPRVRHLLPHPTGCKEPSQSLALFWFGFGFYKGS